MRELSNPQRADEVERELPLQGIHPKAMQVVQSRKVWAGVIGLVATLGLWWVGEIDAARAVEALTWVLGIFIGSVALEDGMTRLFSTLAHTVTTNGAAVEGGDHQEKQQEKQEDEEDEW
jgi:hypothetical protein